MRTISNHLRILFFVGLAFLSFKINAQTDTAETNRQVIEYLYDSIAQKSFEVLLNDDVRVEIKDHFSTNNLDLLKIKDSLVSLDQKIKGVSLAADYANKLILERNNFLNNKSVLESRDSFNAALGQITFSDKIFQNNIIRENKTKEKYVDLEKDVNSLIEEAKTRFSELPTSSVVAEAPNENLSRNDTVNTNSFPDYWLYILGGVLLLSITAHILQARLISKLKKEIGRMKHAAKTQNHVAYQPKAPVAPKFTITKSKALFVSLFDPMVAGLIAEFSKACVSTVDIETYKNSMLQNLETKSFATEEEARTFIEQQVQQTKLKIIDKIDNCRDRHTAEEIADNEIQSSQFRNSKLEDEEIENIVSRHKSNLKKSLQEVIDAKTLDHKIDVVRQNIQRDIAKMIQQNSEYYISFFDTDGTIADSKKSRIRKRDSVVKFVVNSEDPTQATYTLLYDDEAMMKSGIQSYQGLLLPICKIDGVVNPNGTSIVQKGEDGTLILTNGYWKVDKKLTVTII